MIPSEILEIASDFTFHMELEGQGRALWFSESFEKVHGRAPEQLIGKELFVHIHPDDYAHVSAWRRALFSGGTQSVEFRVSYPDEPIRWLRIRGRIAGTPDAQPVTVWGAAWDISEEKRAQAALIESEERYRTLTQHAPMMLFEVDAEGRIIYTTTTSSAEFGYEADELIGAHYYEFLKPSEVDESRAALRDYAASSSGSWRSERTFRHKEGHYIRCELNLERFRHVDGKLRVVGIMLPIEERKKLEEERALYAERLEEEVQERTKALVDANRKLRELQSKLVEAKKLEAEEHLAGSVVHAVNNPLTALIGRAQMALDDPTTDEMRTILRLGRRIEGVVSRTLALYRQGDTSRKPERVEWLIEELIDQVRERALKQSVSIAVDIQASIPMVEVDRSLFMSALSALAENAFDAMPSGGALEIDVEQLLGLNIVRFEICDSGAGVGVDDFGKIFDPFYTTRGGGTGLGLAIARGAVQGHDGRIFLEPGANGGTRATIEIPISPM